MQMGTGLASTQVNPPNDLAQAIARFAKTFVQEAHLHAKGVTKEPHVTVKYGLKTDDVDEIASAVAGAGPATVRLGATAILPNPDKGFDVIIVRVESEDLVDLNRRLTESIESVDTHPGYLPHLTLAYVKPGAGRNYAGHKTFAGVTFTSDQLIFSDAQHRQAVPLG